MTMTLVATTKNMPQPEANLSNARLVLAVGTRAGREAPLQFGYYMIGRHAECQIRPKSRSVSRRHCLLFRDRTGLRVLDLGSKAGTRINDLRLRPRTWQLLQSGDRLRCGKFVFQVLLGDGKVAEQALVETPDPMTAIDAAPDSINPNEPGGVMLVGEAWHDVDVAGFLEDEDDADRERRYDSIRGANADADSDEFQTTVDMDVDLSLFEDPTCETGGQTGGASGAPSSSGGMATGSEGKRGPNDTQQKQSRSKRAKSRKIPRQPEIRKGTKRSLSGAMSKPSFRLPDSERLKLIGFTLLTLAVLGGLGFSAHKFYIGPEVRVLQNID